MTAHPPQQPSTEDEWIIHAINIHGVFFERWCQHTIATTNGCRIRSFNYPVEFPPHDGPVRGEESTLDIRAEISQVDRFLTLVIECKKNNPDLSKWVFFPNYPPSNMNYVYVPLIERVFHYPADNGWDTKGSIARYGWTIPVANEARETKGNYVPQSRSKDQKTLSTLTRTANAAISDAAYQVALATQALLVEETKYSQSLSSMRTAYSTDWHKQILVPIIVTTARLFTCNFAPSDIDPLTGEIPLAKASIHEEPYLFYEYALPPHLQVAPADPALAIAQGTTEVFTRMHILVVHSGSLVDLLTRLASKSAACTDLELDFFTQSNPVKSLELK